MRSIISHGGLMRNEAFCVEKGVWTSKIAVFRLNSSCAHHSPFNSILKNICSFYLTIVLQLIYSILFRLLTFYMIYFLLIHRIWTIIVGLDFNIIFLHHCSCKSLFMDTIHNSFPWFVEITFTYAALTVSAERSLGILEFKASMVILVQYWCLLFVFYCSWEWDRPSTLNDLDRQNVMWASISACPLF